MFCSKCGNKLNGTDRFCPGCGSPNHVTSGIKTLLLKCQNCNGELTVSEDMHAMLCPYCGSKELIIESDAVKIAKLTTATYKDVELGKQQTEMQMKLLDMQEKEKAKKQYILCKLIGLLLMLGSICLFIILVELQDFFNPSGQMISTVICITLFCIVQL